jgi:hypothetical protein
MDSRHGRVVVRWKRSIPLETGALIENRQLSQITARLGHASNRAFAHYRC